MTSKLETCHLFREKNPNIASKQNYATRGSRTHAIMNEIRTLSVGGRLNDK